MYYNVGQQTGNRHHVRNGPFSHILSQIFNETTWVWLVGQVQYS